MRKLVFCLMALLVFYGAAKSQTLVVTGQVTDSAGTPVPNISIKEKGTKNGVIGGQDGSFKLTVRSGAMLEFSGVGFQTIEAPANTVMQVRVSAVTRILDEVIVTALGIRRSKNLLPYAAQQVTGEEVTKTRSANFVNTLSGKVSGLEIRQGNALGASTNIVIRGNKSLSTSNQALFVIDGTPIDNSNPGNTGQAQGRGGYDYGSGASDINPDDIESITVLKGAASTALYGSRASNGVVLITTKRGKRGIGISINSGATFGKVDKNTFIKYQKSYGGGYGSANGYGSPTGDFFYFDVNGDGTPDLVTPTTEDASWGAKFDPSLQVYQWNAFDRTSPNYGKATPWVAAQNDPFSFFETSSSLNNSVFIDGGDEKATFKLGYTRTNDKGILPNSRLNKDLVNFGATYKLSNRLTAGASINFTKIGGLGRYGSGYDAKNPMTNFRQWWQTNVDVNELKDAYFRTRRNITWNWSDPTTTAGLVPIYWDNPYWDRYENYEKDSRSRYFGNVNLNYQVTGWLSVMGRVSLDSYNELQEERVAIGSLPSAVGNITGNSAPASGYSRYDRSFREHNYDLLVNFDRDINKDFNVKALVGGNIRQTNVASILSVTNGGLVVPNLYALSNSVNPIGAPQEQDAKLEVDGVFAGATLTWRNMLTLDGTFRRDHSSTLPHENSKYNYPSISAGFIFSKLLTTTPWISYGKVRANYAEVGSSAPAQIIRDTYTYDDGGTNLPNGTITSFGGASLFSVPNTRNNAKLVPERTKSYEFGLEMNFIQNRFGFDITYYNAQSVNQILPVAVSYATGYAFEYVNAGSIRNKGVELTINLNPVKTRNFSWNLTLNWSKNVNKVEALYNDSKNLLLQSYQGGVSINASLGEAYGTIRGSNFIYDSAGGQRVVKANGYYNNTTTSNEVIGNVNPDWIGGINNNLKYKEFSLAFLVDFRHGGDVFSLDQYYGLATGLGEQTVGLNDLGNPVRNSLANGGGIINPGVTADGKPNTKRVDISTLFGAFGYYRNPAAAFVYDASYVKLREVAITYSVPKAALTKLAPIRGIDVSLIGRNLWIIHKNLPDSDPEENVTSGNAQGYQGGAYPTVRTMGVNLRLRF